MRRLIAGACLAVVAFLSGCGDGQASSDNTLTPAEQTAYQNQFDGHSGSWQCIEHFGDQSDCK